MQMALLKTEKVKSRKRTGRERGFEKGFSQQVYTNGILICTVINDFYITKVHCTCNYIITWRDAVSKLKKVKKKKKMVASNLHICHSIPNSKAVNEQYLEFH